MTSFHSRRRSVCRLAHRPINSVARLATPMLYTAEAVGGTLALSAEVTWRQYRKHCVAMERHGFISQYAHLQPICQHCETSYHSKLQAHHFHLPISIKTVQNRTAFWDFRYCTTTLKSFSAATYCDGHNVCRHWQHKMGKCIHRRMQKTLICYMHVYENKYGNNTRLDMASYGHGSVGGLGIDMSPTFLGAGKGALN